MLIEMMDIAFKLGVIFVRVQLLEILVIRIVVRITLQQTVLRVVTTNVDCM